MAYPLWGCPLQFSLLSPEFDRTRTLRGAACGAVAAGVWALAQPLDKLAISGGYDDVEVLGKAVTRGGAWWPVGFAMHAANGALFGAVYSNLAPLMPVPPPLRGPLLAMTEHVTLWPLAGLIDRAHPARDDLPKLIGNRAAYGQATIRHLLFGLVLGELERRVNAEPEATPPRDDADYSSNGHGKFEHAVSVESAS